MYCSSFSQQFITAQYGRVAIVRDVLMSMQTFVKWSRRHTDIAENGDNRGNIDLHIITHQRNPIVVYQYMILSELLEMVELRAYAIYHFIFT